MMALKKININESAHEILSKGGVFFILKIFALLLSYFFSIIVAQYYNETVYGMVTLGFTILIITSTICRFGFDITLTKIFAFRDAINYNGVYIKAILLSGIFSLIVSSLFYFNADFLATFVFKNSAFSVFLKWTAFTIPLWTILPINSAIFRGLKRNTLYALFDSFGRFLLTVFFFWFFLKYHFDKEYVEMPLVSHFLSLALLFFLSFIIVRSLLNKSSYTKKSNFLPHFNASSTIFISTALFIVLSWIDKIIVGIYSTEDNVGIFHISERIASLIGFNLEAINSILSPKISQAFSSKNIDKMQKDIDFSVSISFIISILSCIIILVFSEFILSLFGEEFIRGKYTLYVFAISHFINVCCGSVGNIMQMTGYQKLFSKIIGIALIIHLLLSTTLVKYYGIIGVAIATAITVIFWNFTGAYYIYKKIGITSFITLNKIKRLFKL